MFDDQAFAPPSLTSPRRLSTLEIEPGYNQLPLPINTAWDNISVFRAVIETLCGMAIFPENPLIYSVVRSSMVKIGQITGFKQIIRPYVLGYGAGKAFNEKVHSHLACRNVRILIVLVGNVSEALQNLMMKHSDIRIFLDHYLPGE
jgi:Protein of unknown function (DUF3435)